MDFVLDTVSLLLKKYIFNFYLFISRYNMD